MPMQQIQECYARYTEQFGGFPRGDALFGEEREYEPLAHPALDFFGFEPIGGSEFWELDGHANVGEMKSWKIFDAFGNKGFSLRLTSLRYNPAMQPTVGSTVCALL